MALSESVGEVNMSMNAKKRVNGSWVDTTLRQNKTATDTITTFPAVLYTTGTTATVVLKGQTVQSGTPTPSSPIQPSECGELTENLFSSEWEQGVINSTNGQNEYSVEMVRTKEYIPIKPNVSYSISRDVFNGFMNVRLYRADRTYIGAGSKSTIQLIIGNTTGNPMGSHTSFCCFKIIASDAAFIRVNDSSNNTTTKWLMIEGEYTQQTMPDYEPYGYKILISSANTTTPVYLGEVETTRRIAKIDLGTLNWGKTASGNFWAATAIQNIRIIGNSSTGNAICDMFKEVSPNTVANEPYSFSSCLNAVGRPFINSTGFEDLTVEEFKEAMSGVYMYYVLANEETGIVNEPLMKIGNYADEVSNISIPTTTGKNIVDVETVLKPSEVSFNYAGWHTAVVHKRINGAWD